MSQQKIQKSPLKNNNPQHQFTEEERKRGRETLTEAGRISLSFNLRKYCTKDCPLYPCFMMPLAMGHPKRLCALKQKNPKERKKILNILLGGREDVIQVYKEILAQVMTKEKPLKVLHAIDRFVRTEFGEKKITEMTGELNIIDQFIKAHSEKKNEQQK